MEKKCAIYNRLSNQNNELLQAKRDELIKYCKDNLKIKDYEIYDETSTNKNQFNKMMKKIDEREFTDILMYSHIYNEEKFGTISDRILSSNTKLHSIERKDNNMNYSSCKHKQTQMETEMETEY